MGVFHFKQFDVDDHGCGMKICSDSVTFGAWFLPLYADAQSVIDVGAGSGLLSLMAAQLMQSAKITALEIDRSAACAANANFKASSWQERMKIIEGNFASYIAEKSADIIISNPPFFTTGMLAADSSRAWARHENSLTSQSLLAFTARTLAPDGHLGIILPADRVDSTIFEAELASLRLRRLCMVYPRQGKDAIRALFDFSPTDGPAEESSLTIRNSDGKLTQEYINLVEDFYIKIS